MPITRAISIRQPLVEQILRGIKKKEFRSRSTNIRERVYLYAALTPRREPALWRSVGCEPGDLPTGVIVGSVEIADCKLLPDGTFAYVLKNPKRIRTHLVPINQPQPGFWPPQF
jgi:hypothetical protein